MTACPRAHPLAAHPSTAYSPARLSARPPANAQADVPAGPPIGQPGRPRVCLSPAAWTAARPQAETECCLHLTAKTRLETAED